MKIITVTSQKGGTGKTSLVHNLGISLARRGKRTLLVDLDGQQNLSFVTVGNNYTKTIRDVIYGTNATECVIPIEEGLSIIPAPDSLYNVKIGGDFRTMLQPLARAFDVVLLDNAPSITLMSISAFLSADYVLCPCCTDVYSLQSFQKTVETVNELKARNRRLKMLGVVMTQVKPNTRIGRDTLADFKTVARTLGTEVLPTIIRDCVAWKLSQINSCSVLDLKPSNASIDLVKLTKDITERIF